MIRYDISRTPSPRSHLLLSNLKPFWFTYFCILITLLYVSHFCSFLLHDIYIHFFFSWLYIVIKVVVEGERFPIILAPAPWRRPFKFHSTLPIVVHMMRGAGLSPNKMDRPVGQLQGFQLLRPLLPFLCHIGLSAPLCFHRRTLSGISRWFNENSWPSRKE